MPSSAPRTSSPPPKTPAVILAAVLVVLPVTASQEGFVPKAAPDPAAIPTAMFGETENIDPERVYTRAEGMERLRVRLSRDYAPKVLACVKAFRDPRRKRMFAAFLDASYNAGPKALCASPMAVQARAGHDRAACDALPGWFVTARYHGRAKSAAIMQHAGWRWVNGAWRKTFPGLVARRRDVERPLCLSGAIT